MKSFSKKNVLKKITNTFKNIPLSIFDNKDNDNQPSVINRKDFLKRSMGFIAFVTVPVLACGNAFDSDDPDDTNDPDYRVSFEITFSEPMDTSSVEAALSISPNPGYATESLSWSENDTVLYYENEAIQGTLYQVEISGEAMDKAGNYLDGDNDGIGGDDYSFNLNAA